MQIHDVISSSQGGIAKLIFSLNFEDEIAFIPFFPATRPPSHPPTEKVVSKSTSTSTPTSTLTATSTSTSILTKLELGPTSASACLFSDYLCFRFLKNLCFTTKSVGFLSFCISNSMTNMATLPQ